MNIKLILAMITLLIVMFGMAVLNGGANPTELRYGFGQPAVFDVMLNRTGTMLYAAYPSDNAIVEIDAYTMQEIRRFTLPRPSCLEFSLTGECILSAYYEIDHGGIARIRLSDGHIELLPVAGYVTDMAIDPSNAIIWVIDRLWPQEGDSLLGLPPENSGNLTLVDYSLSLVVINSVEIEAIPNSIFYSPPYDRLYVKHNLDVWEYIEPPESRDVGPDYVAHKITMYSAESLELIGETSAGRDPTQLSHYAELTGWDSGGLLMMVPACINPQPRYSFRVIDAMDGSVAFDSSHIMYNGLPCHLEYAHPSPDWEYMWATVSAGQLSESDERELMVRINRSTLEYDFFPIDEATDDLGDFAISPDGTTFYLTVPRTGEIIVWQP